VIPQDPIIDEMEGRGLVAALLFVDEHCEGWPTLDDIREIHRLIFQEANPAMAGAYRREQYWPHYTRFVVPDWRKVPFCMGRLELLLEQARQECDALEGLDQQEKVVEWAARIHHRFECIHPFENGNGRTGRAVVTWMLTHYGLPAFDLPEERRTEYIAGLETADAETKTDDLLYTDFWDRQLAALEPLVELIAEALQESTDEKVPPDAVS
jgi:Fic family protein